MKTFKPIFLVAISVASVVMLNSCNYSSDYTPELKVRTEAIAESIQEYGFESVDLSAKKTFGTSGNYDKLIIRLTNGQNIPQDYQSDIPLAQKLLKRILPMVRDTDVYDCYEVVFASSRTIGDETRTDENAIDFNKNK
ncbi:MAG: hypothetical protein ACTHNW_05805 [Mucilaginibacter sp.]